MKTLAFLWLLVATLAQAAGPVRVACLGDSITAGARVDAAKESYPVFLQELLGPGYEVKNFARSGATMWHGTQNHAAQQLPDAVAFVPQVAIVMFGINDTRNEGVDYWDHFAEFETDAAVVLDTLLAAPSKPRILLGLSTANLADMPGMKPERSAVLMERQPRLDAVRAKLRQIAATYAGRGVEVVDLNAATAGQHALYNADGVHFNPVGYRRLAEVLKPRVEAAAQASLATFVLTAPVAEIVASPAAFTRFRAANQPALETLPAGIERKTWLGLQAHLALDVRDPTRAQHVVEELRALTSDPTEKAFAGLTTEAQVGSWNNGASFTRELATRLAALPSTPAIRSVLQKQRDKIAATASGSIMAEAQRLGSQLDAAGRCDWFAADQIVRLHHRLNNILPLRDALLAGLDAAIAARPGA